MCRTNTPVLIVSLLRSCHNVTCLFPKDFAYQDESYARAIRVDKVSFGANSEAVLASSQSASRHAFLCHLAKAFRSVTFSLIRTCSPRKEMHSEVMSSACTRAPMNPNSAAELDKSLVDMYTYEASFLGE